MSVFSLNDICLHEGLEGGFLTKKEVDEIAARISKGVYDRVLKQLEDSTSGAGQPGSHHTAATASRGTERGYARRLLEMTRLGVKCPGRCFFAV